MRKRIVVLAALVAGLVAAMAVSAPTATAGGFVCGGIVGPGGTHVMTNDIPDCDKDPALTIVGPVKVNLGGHTISADPDNPPAHGIIIEGDRAKLTNGTVTGFGVQSNSSDAANVVVGGDGRHLLTRLTILGTGTGAFHAGIQVLDGSDHNRLLRNRADDNRDQGILVESDFNKILHNTTRRGEEGVEVIGGNDNLIAYNKALRNSDENLSERDGTARNTWIRNVAMFAGDEGFRTDESAVGSRFLFNTVIGNAAEGVEINGVGLLVLGNTVRDNGTSGAPDDGGIEVRGDDNTVKLNRVIGNDDDGIRVQGDATGNTIKKNIARGNGNGTSSFDLHDATNAGPCVNNAWTRNIFRTGNDTCIS